MLESFRKLSKHIVFKILFGLLLLSFAFSGVTGLTNISFRQEYLVKVGDARITKEMVETKYEQAVRNVRRTGLDLDEQQLAAYGISRQQIMQTLVQESLISQESANIGIEIGDEAMKDQIRTMPEFQTAGKFDKDKFREMITSVGFTEPQFTEYLRTNMRNNLVLNTLLVNLPHNDFIAGKQSDYYSEQRDVEVMIIPKNYKTVSDNPSESDLKDFYFENSAQFQVPETRDLHFVTFKPSDKTAPDVQDTVNAIDDEIAGGSTLEEIAKKLNLKLEEKKGVVQEDENLSPIFLEAAFVKKEGEVSDLVHENNTNEYFVIVVNKVNEARIPELAEVKAEVAKAWKDEKANSVNLQYVSTLADKIRSAGDFTKIASENGFHRETISGITRMETPKYGARFVGSTFGSLEGEVIGWFQNEDGSYKLGRLLAIKPVKASADNERKVKDELNQIVQAEIFDQYFAHLTKKFTVKQNPNLQAKSSGAVKPVNIVKSE